MIQYKIIPLLPAFTQQTYWRIEANGDIHTSVTEDDPEFQAWLAEGNEPLPPDQS